MHDRMSTVCCTYLQRWIEERDVCVQTQATHLVKVTTVRPAAACCLRTLSTWNRIFLIVAWLQNSCAWHTAHKQSSAGDLGAWLGKPDMLRQAGPARLTIELACFIARQSTGAKRRVQDQTQGGQRRTDMLGSALASAFGSAIVGLFPDTTSSCTPSCDVLLCASLSAAAV